MATINYSAERINELLAAAASAAQAEDVERAVSEVADTVGDPDALRTTEKGNLVAAINELFTSASEGKASISAALTGKGQPAAATDPWATLARLIVNLEPAGYVDPADYLPRLVANDGSITPTGSYASATYYNVSFGVKIGYCPNGDILIAMKGGTSTSYENLNFTLASAPTGVAITTSSTSWDTSDPAGNLYVCVLTGITSPVNIAVAMTAVNSSYDYVTCAITVTEAA